MIENNTHWKILDEEKNSIAHECRGWNYDPSDPIQFREFTIQRDRKIKRVKDRKKSRAQQKNFKKNRREYMKGIKRFHKSSKGKRFHRNLGRFLATTAQREGCTAHVTPRNIVEIVSAKIHLNIGGEYLVPGYLEAAEFALFREQANERLLEILSLVESGDRLDEDDLYFLMHLVHPKAIKDTMHEGSAMYQKVAQGYINDFGGL